MARAKTVTLDTLRADAVEAVRGSEKGVASVHDVLRAAGTLAGTADKFDAWLEGVRADLKSAKLGAGSFDNYASRVRKMLRAGLPIPATVTETRDAAAKLDKDGKPKPEPTAEEKEAEKKEKAREKEEKARIEKIPLEGRLLLVKLQTAAIALMLADPTLGVAATGRAYAEIETAADALLAAKEGKAAPTPAPEAEKVKAAA